MDGEEAEDEEGEDEFFHDSGFIHLYAKTTNCKIGPAIINRATTRDSLY